MFCYCLIGVVVCLLFCASLCSWRCSVAVRALFVGVCCLEVSLQCGCVVVFFVFVVVVLCLLLIYVFLLVWVSVLDSCALLLLLFLL